MVYFGAPDIKEARVIRLLVCSLFSGCGERRRGGVLALAYILVYAILGAVPAGCGAALEVGCGDGLLASRLVERCAEVTAIDRDPRMTALARSRAEAPGPGRMTVVEADYLAYPVADASFD